MTRFSLQLLHVDAGKDRICLNQDKAFIVDEIYFVKEEHILHVWRCQTLGFTLLYFPMIEIEQEILLVFNVLRVVMI